MFLILGCYFFNYIYCRRVIFYFALINNIPKRNWRKVKQRLIQV
ncbi:hypothetical protein ESA_00131 [Cronobacter sakazakii ATCC BAA-894]|uniref:Uncharacterized protein n=1 Tax=Cronobacter sakazakii (strain ATCC BAA-894) TaxID=290339 RepID=A7MPI9_CROS8|nr:hypothetical protein ESA_00131 [Cronobacter sakazakii ATCC BAA-894]